MVRIGSGGTNHEQVAADLEMMLRLSVDTDGSAWTSFVEYVYEYAVRTVFKLIKDGALPARVDRAVPDDQMAAEDMQTFLAATAGGQRKERRDEVVKDATLNALDYWRRTVIPDRRWSPEGGASIRTFFVQAVLMRLLNRVRIELRALGEEPAERERISRELAAATRELPSGETAYDRADDVDAACRRLADVLPLLGRTELRIATLAAKGLTQRQIAAQLGLPSAKAVESRLGRLRERLSA